jgi:hypothetical protein
MEIRRLFLGKAYNAFVLTTNWLQLAEKAFGESVQPITLVAHLQTTDFGLRYRDHRENIGNYKAMISASTDKRFCHGSPRALNALLK